jgi:hypothetical protein
MQCVLDVLWRAAGHIAGKISANTRVSEQLSRDGWPRLATTFPSIRSHRFTLIDIVVKARGVDFVTGAKM